MTRGSTDEYLTAQRARYVSTSSASSVVIPTEPFSVRATGQWPWRAAWARSAASRCSACSRR